MGDKREKRDSITKLRLAYDSTAQGGDGQFHEHPRNKPQVSAKRRVGPPAPPDTSCRESDDTEVAYDGQFDVHRLQRQMDGAIDFDHNLDHVRQGVLQARSFLNDTRNMKKTQARAAMIEQIKRVAVLDDQTTWTSRTHDGAVRDLQKKHGKAWKTHYDVHHDVGELRHCTVDGLHNIAVSMLFREQRKDGNLARAKALIDFMDDRAARGLAPPKRSDPLYDCPSVFVNDFCSAHWAYNRSDAAHDVSNTYAVIQEWPYDWVMRDDHPALLKYMIDKKSCLLAPTLEVTPKIIKSYFQTQPGFVHGRPLQSDRDIDLSKEFVDTNHPLARLPGHMRHLVEQVRYAERPDVRNAAQTALEDINRMDFDRDAKLRAEMLRLKKQRERHQTIWSPPDHQS